MAQRGLKGGPELLALIDMLPDQLVRKVLRGGLRAGAVVIANQAKVNVRYMTGKLRRAIKVKTGTEAGQPRAWVKLSGPHAYIGTFVEYGVRPHFIRVREQDKPFVRRRSIGVRRASMTTVNRMVRAGSLVIGGHFVGPVVHHPGSGEHPFMRPALDQRADDAVNTMGRYVAARLKWGQLAAPELQTDDD